jgi:hypothetical protein
MPSPGEPTDKSQPGRTEPALRDYLAAIALIVVVGGLALVLLGCQTSRILSNVSGPI